MYFNRPVVKMEVKQSMRQTRPHPMLVTLLYLVVVGVGAWLISWLMNTLFSGGEMSLENLYIGFLTYGEDYLENFMYYYSPEYFAQMMVQAGTISLIVSILTTAWNGLMAVGYTGYCLEMSRNTNPPLEQIFRGFSRAGSVILAYILVAVFMFLWTMLFTVGLVLLFFIAVLLAETVRALAILSILLVFAAPILYAAALIWVSYRYVMVPFAIADSQNPLSAMDAIRASKAIMQGRKVDFFILRLSFIGWYLLEALVVIVGVIIAFASAAGTIYRFEYWLSYGGYDYLRQILPQLLAPMLPIVLVCGVIIFILNLWLTPYRTGCEAHFYLYAMGGSQPAPYQPGPYGGQPGPYGGRSGPYGGQSGPYGGQPGPYGGQPGPYGSQPGPYGGYPGPYNNNPYGYQPPSQSTFGGYAQGAQPPQYGAGTYSQWGAPQAPQAPVPAAAEPPAAPAAPADPETPVIPESPEFPETVIASVFDQTPVAPAAPAAPEPPVIPESPEFPESVTASVFDRTPAAPDDAPAEPADAPYEEPYAEPEAPNDDDTPQKRDGPSYSQY